jgi:protein-tyrosine phosphatase
MQLDATGLTRRIRLEGAFNFRDLGGYPARDGQSIRWRRVFRSDSLAQLTDDDCRALEEMSLATVIDLRSRGEVERLGRIREFGTYRYHHIPMADVLPDTTDVRWSSPGFVAQRYQEMLDDAGPRLREVLAIIADRSSQPVVFHCAAGKDRAGITAVIILGLLGVERENIVADYAATAAAMERMVEHWVAADPGRAARMRPHLPAITSTRPENVIAFLDLIDNRYGSIEEYGISIGAQAAAASLRSTLLI